MTYNVFGGTLNLAQFNSIQFQPIGTNYYMIVVFRPAPPLYDGAGR